MFLPNKFVNIWPSRYVRLVIFPNECFTLTLKKAYSIGSSRSYIYPLAYVLDLVWVVSSDGENIGRVANLGSMYSIVVMAR